MWNMILYIIIMLRVTLKFLWHVPVLLWTISSAKVCFADLWFSETFHSSLLSIIKISISFHSIILIIPKRNKDFNECSIHEKLFCITDGLCITWVVIVSLSMRKPCTFSISEPYCPFLHNHFQFCYYFFAMHDHHSLLQVYYLFNIYFNCNVTSEWSQAVKS